MKRISLALFLALTVTACATVTHAAEFVYEIYEIFHDNKNNSKIKEINQKIEEGTPVTFGDRVEKILHENQIQRN